MKQQPKTCAYCGQEFIPERRNGMYCSPTCRQYSYIKRKTGEAPYERAQQKENVKQELQFVPPLILEGSTQNEKESNEPMLEEIELLPTEKNEINNQSKESTMNYNQSNTKPSNSVARNNMPYEMIVEEEKAYFNDELADWWNFSMGEQKEKNKLIAENQNAKNFIRQILNFDGKEVTREHLQKFMFQMNKAINATSKQSSCFIYGHMVIGEASVQPALVLDQWRAERKTSGIFRLGRDLRAKLEIMLRFINEFNMRSPEFWLVP